MSPTTETGAARVDSSISVEAEPAALRSFSRRQKERLVEVLDQYLCGLEGGLPLDPEKIVEEHPDLREPLRTYFQGLADLHQIAAGFGHPSQESGISSELCPDDATRLGDFVLVREVGRGGMGIVYEAQQLSLCRRVALKVLPFACVLDAQQIARFRNEAHAAAQLQHPNIVPVFTVGTERGVHFYAMQFIEGRSLDHLISELRAKAPSRSPAATAAATNALLDESQTLDEKADSHGAAQARSFLSDRFADRHEYSRTIVQLGIQAADALHAAHSYGIVHRDIKPSNLLLDGDGKLWVTDFGLARCQSDLTLTKTGDVVGTQRYMSPEQALGQSALVDQRCDVYSLGATLYELLTLEPAFAAESGPALLRAIDRQEPKRPRLLEPQLPADLETVVLKAMARLREDRYLTAEELADDLRRFLEGKPTIARPPAFFDRIGKWGRRRRRWVIGGLAASVLTMIGLAAGMFLISREQAKTDQNYRRAETHFRQARETVDRFGSQLAERLSDVPGAEQVRRELLEETLAYYRQFVEQAGSDAALRADLAVTYSKIAAVCDEIGSHDEAIAAYQQALDLFERLSAAEPTMEEYRRRVGICENNLALALGRSGRTADAQELIREAIGLQERLSAADPTSQEYRADLARSYNNLGRLQCDIGGEADAKTSFLKAIESLERLVSDAPPDADMLRDLAASYNNLASLEASHSPSRAVELYEKAVDHQRQAALSKPDERKYQRDLALTLSNLGAVQSKAQQLSAAAASYGRAIALQQGLLLAAPQHRSYRGELAVSQNNLGLTWTKMGRLADAERSFREALSLQTRLVAENPHGVENCSSVAGIYNNLGIVLEQRGNIEESAESYRQAIEHQRVALSEAPAIDRYRLFLSKHYYNLGRVSRRIGHVDDAVQAALARKELWPKDGERLFSVAEELALASKLPGDQHPTGFTADKCMALSVATLREAVAAGVRLPADLQRRESFAGLRGRPEFTAVVGK